MARTKYGLPGIYNASPITLQDGEGSALAVDDNGVLVVNTSGGGGPTVVSEAPSSGVTTTPVSSSTSSTVLQSANSSRRGLLVYNNSTASLYVVYAGVATTSAFTVKLLAGQYWEMPQPTYTGDVAGIWDAANGNAQVVELT